MKYEIAKHNDFSQNVLPKCARMCDYFAPFIVLELMLAEESDEIKSSAASQLFVSDRDNISQLLRRSVKRGHLSPAQDIAFRLM